MTAQIELAIGQTWQCRFGENRTIKLIENGWVCYYHDQSATYNSSPKSEFIPLYARKLIPQTVRKSQCVGISKYNLVPVDLYIGLFDTEEKAREFCEAFDYIFKQWPLVVNGVEQWVEVPTE